MKKYIFGERNGIYIINLEITISCIEHAVNFLKSVAAEGKDVLFIGTKKQAQEALREAADRCGMPYVNQRWLGGMLTNFETIRKSLKRLEEIDRMEQEGNFQFVTKKEASMIKKEREKLVKNLSGLRNMKRLPGAIFVIDSKKEEIAIHEASNLGIPIVGVLDTNCDPDSVDYPIPGNDDAIRAIKLFCELAAHAIQEGRNILKGIAPESAVETVVGEADAEAVAAVEGVEADRAAPAAEEDVPADPIEEKLAERFADKVVVEDVDVRSKPKKGVRKETGRTK